MICDGGVKNSIRNAMKRAISWFVYRYFPILGLPGQVTFSNRRGFIARSFSIKNEANSPWNALDPSEI